MDARQARKVAEARGIQHGSATASRIDINSDADATWLLEGYDNGDPKVMDLCPEPLSGEHGGESIEEILGDLLKHRLPTTQESIMDLYEASFAVGFWDSLHARACELLTPSSDGEHDSYETFA